MYYSIWLHPIKTIILCVPIVAGAITSQNEQSDRGSHAREYQRKTQGESDKQRGKAADLSHNGDTVLALTTHQASNGIRVNIASGIFSFEKQAEEELQYRAKAATKVTQQTPKKDASGQVVGQRVLAISSNAKGDVFWLVWTKGREYYFLSSPSREAILDIENRVESQTLYH